MSFEALNLRETRAWLLARRRGLAEIPKRFANSGELHSWFQAIAKEAVRDVVYSYPENPKYPRTYALLNSVSAASGEEDCIDVFIPLTDETAAITGKDKGKIVYGQYLLPPEIKGRSPDSFWQGTLPRNFLGVWEQAFAELAPKAFDEEVRRELAK